MIRKVQCLTVACVLCGQPMDDFAGEGGDLIHFSSMLEVVAHLGGVYEGRMFEGSGRSGGVLLPDGRFFCYLCKIKEHVHLPSPIIADICARCGQLRGEHPDKLTEGPGHGDLPKRSEHRRRAIARSDRSSWCVTACAPEYEYPLGDLPEPAEGARIEFVHHTDRYAARRDTESSVLAGSPADMCWTLYPDSTGHTWACMLQMFGPSLENGILLAPAGVLRPVSNG